MEGMVDIHCHILPEVDDGARSMEEALKLLRTEYAQGVRCVILTPHYRGGLFETPRGKIQRVFEKLTNRAQAEDLKIELLLGCEFHREMDMWEKLSENAAYRMAGTSYVLLEFAGQDSIECIKYYVTELVIRGFRPVIAHAERYPALREIRHVRFLVDSGAHIQINAGSLAGMEGWSSRRFCTKLLQEDLVHFVGSDAHNMEKRKPYFDKCAALLEKKAGAQQARRLLLENPAKLIANEYL
ncbi:MAG: capsular biosynthesis protein [Eubacteriales bacterium]|nr:capsular biosynthesis protein [Eubacteriales bacterium]